MTEDPKIKGIILPSTNEEDDETRARQEIQDFTQQLETEWLCREDNETNKARLNEQVHDFKQYMKQKYPDYELYFKLEGDLAYYTTTWTVKTICEAHKKYSPDTHIEKEEYTRMEINNMLFALQELYDVIRSHSQVAVPYSAYKDYNEQIFDGLVAVECRYCWEEDEII